MPKKIGFGYVHFLHISKVVNRAQIFKCTFLGYVSHCDILIFKIQVNLVNNTPRLYPTNISR